MKCVSVLDTALPQACSAGNMLVSAADGLYLQLYESTAHACTYEHVRRLSLTDLLDATATALARSLARASNNKACGISYLKFVAMKSRGLSNSLLDV